MENFPAASTREGTKVYPGDVALVSLVEERFFENPKKTYSTKNLTQKLYIGHFGGNNV